MGEDPLAARYAFFNGMSKKNCENNLRENDGPL
jgi:hypothetical protein